MQGKTVQYYFTPVSPWAYLGHERFCAIARKVNARVEVLPVNFGTIFPASGGLPLDKRAPQRQAYRLVELARWSAWLGVLLNVKPRHFPADPTQAARLVIAVAENDGAEAALSLSGALMTAVWAQDRDIADPKTLALVLAECNLPAQRLETSQAASVAEQYVANTQRALEAGVFGAPSYVVDGEIFWGQDRLDFLERRLVAGH
jgi:2-hydroxychromene-2-carboxylate isomerase